MEHRHRREVLLAVVGLGALLSTTGARCSPRPSEPRRPDPPVEEAAPADEPDADAASRPDPVAQLLGVDGGAPLADEPRAETEPAAADATPPPDLDQLLSAMRAHREVLPPEVFANCEVPVPRGARTLPRLISALDRGVDRRLAECEGDGAGAWRCSVSFGVFVPEEDGYFQRVIELRVGADGAIEPRSVRCETWG